MKIHKNIFRLWLLLLIPLMLVGLYYFYKTDRILLDKPFEPIAANIGKTFEFKYLIDSAENPVTLKLKSDITIVDFWYTQCPPCIAELKQFEGLITGRERDISILSISIDNLKEWKEIFQFRNSRFDFINAKLPNWLIVNLHPTDSTRSAVNYILKNYGFSTYPGYFVLNRFGKIIATPVSAVDYIKNMIYDRSGFAKYLSEHIRTRDEFLDITFIMLSYTGAFWIIAFLILFIKRLLQRNQTPVE